MAEYFMIAYSFSMGGILGIAFYGGLWWTIRKAMISHHPSLWFFSSLLVRITVVVVGFYLVSAGDWRRMLFCLLGFIIARHGTQWKFAKETNHAPKS